MDSSGQGSGWAVVLVGLLVLFFAGVQGIDPKTHRIRRYERGYEISGGHYMFWLLAIVGGGIVLKGLHDVIAS